MSPLTPALSPTHGAGLQIGRFDNVIAIRSGNRVVGFHSHNLQVAELDPQVWAALESPTTAPEAVWTELEQWNKEIDTAVTDGKVAQTIRALTINIAQICNLKCTYCAAGGDGTYGSKTAKIDVSRATSQLDMLLHDVPNGGKFAINFLGGEPLVYPQALFSIARHAQLAAAGRDIAVHFEVTTNGTLVTPEVAEMLAKLQCNVTVSFDGPAAINDKVRPTIGGLGSTARTLKGISELFKVRERLTSLNVHAVFGEHNVDVLTSYEYLREWDWSSITLTYAVGANDETYSPLFIESLFKAAERAFKLGGEAELRRIAQFDHIFRIFDGQQRIHNYCGAGKSLLQVDTEGRFTICNWFVNDAKEEIGRDLTIDKHKLKPFADTLINMNNCHDCWAKYVCGGGCMFVHRSRTGNKHKTDPEFCARMRGVIAKGIDYYEQTRNANQGQMGDQ